MISRPDPRELTQGTIFTCALTENYLDCGAYGMIITARCDVANDKTPIFSYVPVIPYKHWMSRDGVGIVASRALANSTGEIKKSIKSAGLAESIFDTLSEESIVKLIEEDISKAGKARVKKIQDNFSTIQRAKEIILACDEKSAGIFLDENSGLYKALVKDLLGNAVADFHYLEEIEFEGKTDGFVASLREIRLMPSTAAIRILNGLTKADFDRLGVSGLHFRSDDDYAMPVGLLKSPYIEFLMQRITNLFARIGVTDASQSRAKSLVELYTLKAETYS
jgi:hypothetical protein